MAAGKLEEACQRFAESRRIEPAIGTTMNLARCYLKLGRTASAWLLYRETAATARALGQSDREQHALHELAAIEPDLAKVVVESEPELLTDARVELQLDGAAIPASLVGSELPVDPGKHRLVVRTSRAELWSAELDVEPRHTEHSRIPHLDVPPEPVEPAPSAAPPRRPAATADRTPDAARGAPPGWLSSRRVAALSLAGVAAVGAGYAVVETFQAISANRSSDPGSCKPGSTCSADAIASRERAFDSASRADVAAGVSGACLVAAGVLWFLGAPSAPPVSAQASTSSWAVTYRGTW